MQVTGQFNSLAALPAVKNPVVHWVGLVVGPQIRSGCFGENKNLVILPGFESPIVPICSLLAIRFECYAV